MTNNNFLYTIGLKWQGSVDVNKNYRYNKTYELSFNNKPTLIGSADTIFHGNATLYNPEEMLLSALASCHMMSFFYLCGKNKIIIQSYKDEVVGTLQLNPNGSGQFTEALLQPTIKVISPVTTKQIAQLFVLANDYCFIARSCNFTIQHQPTIVLVD